MVFKIYHTQQDSKFWKRGNFGEPFFNKGVIIT